MERGAGGGAGERTLEQAFKQCVSEGRVLEQDVTHSLCIEVIR